MEWHDIWKIVLSITTSVGGVGVIIVAVIKFSSNIIANRLEEKYTHKLNRELEKYKATLENKNYISKAKFDKEFEMYQLLSKAFFHMVQAITLMIPSGLAYHPVDKDKKKEYEDSLYKDAHQKLVEAQDLLYSDAPFVSESMFERLEEILGLCQKQLIVFERRWNVYILATQEEKEEFKQEDYERSETIKAKFLLLIKDLRKYLSSLEVIN